MQNAVGKYSSTLRTMILYTFVISSLLILHNTFFQLRDINLSNKSCFTSSLPFMKPDFERKSKVSKTLQERLVD